MTAFKSPRTPTPLLLKTFTTRVTYAADGLLVTNAWIKRVQMNGPTFG